MRRLRVDGRDALRKEGVSPLTEFKYVNLPWGRTMWFIWTNSDEAHAAIYDHMVASFEFGEKTPRTLQEIYGQRFQPVPLDGIPVNASPAAGTVTKSTRSSKVPGLAAFSVPQSAPTRYIAPVRQYYPINCGNLNWAGCGGTHTGGASQAVDIGTPDGTGVYASQPGLGTAIQLRWSNTGYGNLVRLQQGSDIAYYAHLQSIDVDNIVFTPPYWGLYQNSHVGDSGHTGCDGNNCAPHLHFHIQRNGSGVNLSGMTDLTLYSSYPSCGHTTCPSPPDFSCVCGRVH